MSVRRAQRHILSDLKLELLIYRIFLLSPFQILQGQQLATKWRIKLYMCLMLFVYTTLRISLCLQSRENNRTFKFFSKNGNMFMFINIFDFTFSSLSFVAIVLNGLITNSYHIEFFYEVHHFDVILFAAFGIPVRRSRTRTTIRCALIVGLVYFLGYYFGSLIDSGNEMLTPYQYFTYYFTFYIDSIVSFLTGLYYVNCTQLCRDRLASVRILLRNYNNFSTEQVDTVFQLYARIRGQICLINKFLGFIVLLKIAHDFTLGSSITYMMCSSLYRAENIFEIILWFIETVIGTLFMIIAAEMLITETNECAKMLSTIRTDDVSGRNQNRVDNFLLWIRHHLPVLNACGLFPIDLRLLFVMSGGIITYMIVLLQLQDYDDQSINTLEFL